MLLFDFFSQRLILEVIASTTKIPKAALLLARGYGIIPWLHEIIYRDEDVCETELGIIIISIIENLLNSFNNSTEDVSHYKFLLFRILLRLKACSR